MDFDEIRRTYARPAILLEPGDPPSPEPPKQSWFGRVNLGAPGEAWPSSGGRPMIPLCQIDLRILPFRPPRLDDVEFLTVFMDAEDLPDDTPNGDGWCLRAYADASVLVPIETPDHGSWLQPFPLEARVHEADFPVYDDLPFPAPDGYHDEFDTEFGFKLGGWPALVQSEIYWAPHNRHPAVPEYVFQIDTCHEADWSWGDSGFGYFGRGTAPGHEDEWTLAWQCY